ncbi:MAG: hypothetical protein IKA54_05465 [Clostridia bacterium]|nr:hypothetical protein [Clostridia bacterium]
MIVTFCGHSLCSLNGDEMSLLEKQLIDIIENEPNCNFYLGGYGNFDKICFDLLSKLKSKYTNIKRVFITPYLYNYDKLKSLSKIYDETMYPPIETAPPKFAIDRRNRWMIENSDMLICYITHTFGGAYKTYKYALNKNIKIINIFQN